MENPTYQRLGDHSETIQIDFDPAVITYAEILEFFWSWHNPAAIQWSRQYMSAIFYHDQLQHKVITERIARVEQEFGSQVNTEILPLTVFYLAEDYHQKYFLQNEQELAHEIKRYYPGFKDFVDSTAAARLNGIIGGYADSDLLEKELDMYGLSPLGLEILKRYTK